MYSSHPRNRTRTVASKPLTNAESVTSLHCKETEFLPGPLQASCKEAVIVHQAVGSGRALGRF